MVSSYGSLSLLSVPNTIEVCVVVTVMHFLLENQVNLFL